MGECYFEPYTKNNVNVAENNLRKGKGTQLLHLPDTIVSEDEKDTIAEILVQRLDDRDSRAYFRNLVVTKVPKGRINYILEKVMKKQNIRTTRGAVFTAEIEKWAVSELQTRPPPLSSDMDQTYQNVLSNMQQIE